LSSSFLNQNYSPCFRNSYSFDEDQYDPSLDSIERFLTYPTPSGMSEEKVFQICSDMIVNSTIAKACGRLFDRDIMQAVDICVMGG